MPTTLESIVCACSLVRRCCIAVGVWEWDGWQTDRQKLSCGEGVAPKLRNKNVFKCTGLDFGAATVSFSRLIRGPTLET